MAASIATTQHCRPNRSAMPLRSSGRSTAAVLTETLSAPASSRCQASSTARTPPPTVSGIDSTSRTRRTVSCWWPRPSGVAETSRMTISSPPGVLVEPRPLGRVAGVAQALEAHALDHAAMADVEAGDDARGQHQPQLQEARQQRLAIGAGELGMELAADDVAALHGGHERAAMGRPCATVQPGASVAR